MTEIRKADRGARRRALTIVVAGAVVGGAIILAADGARPVIESWLAANAERLVQYPSVAASVMAVVMLPVAGFALYLRRYGAAVVASERFPLAGEEVVRDTPVRFGARAVRQGRAMQALAILLLAASAALPLLLWATVRTLSE